MTVRSSSIAGAEAALSDEPAWRYRTEKRRDEVRRGYKAYEIALRRLIHRTLRYSPESFDTYMAWMVASELGRTDKATLDAMADRAARSAPVRLSRADADALLLALDGQWGRDQGKNLPYWTLSERQRREIRKAVGMAAGRGRPKPSPVPVIPGTEALRRAIAIEASKWSARLD